MKYRNCDKSQTSIFGLDIASRIPENHLVRFVDKLIDEIDISEIELTYSHDGCPGYSPRMMLKVVVYAYMNQIYTSRKIAKAIRENINFIWLTAEQTPDFRTINTFCWTRCRDLLADIFAKVVIKADELGYLERDCCFIDGTTFRANANKNSHVWKTNVLRYQKQVKQRVINVFRQIELMDQDEDILYKGKDLNELGEHLQGQFNFEDNSISADQMKKMAEQEESRLEKILDKLKAKNATTKDDKTIKKLQSIISSLRKAKKADIPKLEKYEVQLQIIGEYRNSYAKTDHDATFLKMKDDTIAPSYMFTISTSNQYVTGINIYNSARETKEFPPLMEILNNNYGSYPQSVIADAAYGTASNLHYAYQKGMDSYLKLQDYRIGYKETTFNDLTYDATNDEYLCSEGKRFVFEQATITTENGPEREVRKYTCYECLNCKKASKCIRQQNKSKRSVTMDPYMTPLRRQTVSNLRSDDGKKLYKRRCHEPESIFAFMKWNWQFSRFTVRTMKKCKAQLEMILIGHNIKKIYKNTQKLTASYA